MDMILKVDEKGRVELPKKVQKKYQIQQNDELLLIEQSDTLILKKKETKSKTNGSSKMLNDDNNSTLEKYIRDTGSWLLNLPENWDEQGAKAFRNELWETTKTILTSILQGIWDVNSTIPIPEILPLADGSIDLNWQSDRFKLLVNFPRDISSQVHIFGRDFQDINNDLRLQCKYELVEKAIVEWLKTIR